jgi:hypothetical protein
MVILSASSSRTPHEVAHDQVDAQGTPAVSFDASVAIINGSPFPRCDSLAILAGNTWEAPVLVQLPAVDTAVGCVDEAVRQLRGIKGHPCSGGCTDERHDDRRPRERCPSMAVRGWLREEWAELHE